MHFELLKIFLRLKDRQGFPLLPHVFSTCLEYSLSCFLRVICIVTMSFWLLYFLKVYLKSLYNNMAVWSPFMWMTSWRSLRTSSVRASHSHTGQDKCLITVLSSWINLSIVCFAHNSMKRRKAVSSQMVKLVHIPIILVIKSLTNRFSINVGLMNIHLWKQIILSNLYMFSIIQLRLELCINKNFKETLACSI